MPYCETCNGTGTCPCGATDCGPKRCPDCFCDSCSEAGKEIVGKSHGKNICDTCYLDEVNARDEDAWDDRPGRGSL